MADPSNPAASPVPAADSATAAAASPAPVQAATDAAAPSPAPVVDSAPVAESAPAAAPVAEKSLLGAEPAKEAEKPADVTKPADTTQDKTPDPAKAPDGTEPKKEEAAQSAEPAPLPTYEAFTLPEGVTLEGEKLGEFTKELAEFQVLTKADQAEVQKFGQRLVDRHVAEVKTAIDRLNEHYVNSWEKQKADWKEAFMKDPEMGGNRQETTIKAAVEFIKTHGGSEAHQKEFRELMDTTGLGNHPAIIRMLANASLAMREGKPLPAPKPAAEPTSKVAKRYGGSP